jgi:hypothetical protein
MKGKIIDEIIVGIKNANSNYFTNLATSYYARDNYALKSNLELGAQLLYAGLLSSVTMMSVDTTLQRIFTEVNPADYNLNSVEDVNRFFTDLSNIQFNSSATAAVFVAGAVAVVAVIAVATVVVAVSWVGLVQIGGAVLAYVELWGPSNELLNLVGFDGEVLTYELIEHLEESEG